MLYLILPIQGQSNFTSYSYLAPESTFAAEKTKSPWQIAYGVRHDINNQLLVVIGYLDLIIMKMESMRDTPLIMTLQRAKMIQQISEELASANSSWTLNSYEEMGKKIRTHTASIIKDIQWARECYESILKDAYNEAHFESAYLAAVSIDAIAKRLFFSSTEQDDKKIEDLARIAREALKICKKSPICTDAEAIGISFNFITADLKPAGPIFANENELRSSMLNIMINALHAMRNGGTLTLQSGETDHGMVWLSITDTGTGISKENLKKIFDRGFTTKKTVGGMGQGLALVNETVTRIKGGKVTVDSELGTGTTFILSFKKITDNELRDENSEKRTLVSEDDQKTPGVDTPLIVANLTTGQIFESSL